MSAISSNVFAVLREENIGDAASVTTRQQQQQQQHEKKRKGSTASSSSTSTANTASETAALLTLHLQQRIQHRQQQHHHNNSDNNDDDDDNSSEVTSSRSTVSSVSTVQGTQSTRSKQRDVDTKLAATKIATSTTATETAPQAGDKKKKRKKRRKRKQRQQQDELSEASDKTLLPSPLPPQQQYQHPSQQRQKEGDDHTQPITDHIVDPMWTLHPLQKESQKEEEETEEDGYDEDEDSSNDGETGTVVEDDDRNFFSNYVRPHLTAQGQSPHFQHRQQHPQYHREGKLSPRSPEALYHHQMRHSDIVSEEGNDELRKHVIAQPVQDVNLQHYNLQSQPQTPVSPHNLYQSVSIPGSGVLRRPISKSISMDCISSGSSSAATPLSPSRSLFQSVSTVDALTKSLEEWASTINDSRTDLWSDWIRMIREAEMSPQAYPQYYSQDFKMLNFKDVFFKSNAIEKIIGSVIRNPKLSSITELWELFDICLLGSSQDHSHLISCLETLGASLQGKSPNIVHKAVLIVQNMIKSFKFKPEQEESLRNSLSAIDSMIAKKQQDVMGIKLTQTAKLTHTAEVVRLYDQKRDMLDRYMQRKVIRPGDDILRAGSRSTTPEMDIKRLDRLRIDTQMEQGQELAKIERSIDDLEIVHEELSFRKAQLLHELEKVDQDLHDIGSRLAEEERRRQDVELHFSKIFENIDRQYDGLRNIVDIQHAEKIVFDKLKTFVNTASHIMDNSLDTRSLSLSEELDHTTREYIKQLGDFLGMQQSKMLGLITHGIAKPCEKINSLRARGIFNEGFEPLEERYRAERHIKKYYERYTNALTSAQEILKTAEKINKKVMDEREKLSRYDQMIEEHVDKRLEYLSKMETVIGDFGSRISWIHDEIPGIAIQHTSADTPDGYCSEVSSVISGRMFDEYSEISSIASGHGDNLEYDYFDMSNSGMGYGDSDVSHFDFAARPHYPSLGAVSSTSSSSSARSHRPKRQQHGGRTNSHQNSRQHHRHRSGERRDRRQPRHHTTRNAPTRNAPT